MKYQYLFGSCYICATQTLKYLYQSIILIVPISGKFLATKELIYFQYPFSMAQLIYGKHLHRHECQKYPFPLPSRFKGSMPKCTSSWSWSLSLSFWCSFFHAWWVEFIDAKFSMVRCTNCYQPLPVSKQINIFWWQDVLSKQIKT